MFAKEQREIDETAERLLGLRAGRAAIEQTTGFAAEDREQAERDRERSDKLQPFEDAVGAAELKLRSALDVNITGKDLIPFATELQDAIDARLTEQQRLGVPAEPGDIAPPEAAEGDVAAEARAVSTGPALGDLFFGRTAQTSTPGDIIAGTARALGLTPRGFAESARGLGRGLKEAGKSINLGLGQAQKGIEFLGAELPVRAFEGIKSAISPDTDFINTQTGQTITGNSSNPSIRWCQYLIIIQPIIGE